MSATLNYTGEICVGSAEQIPMGEGRSFQVGDHEVALFRGRQGDLYAVQNRCPHRDAPLADGVFGSGQLICPYHSYKFNLANGECLTDASCSLRAYPVREQEGLILLTLE
jgi:nitrite reductase (NADH) small subunit